MKHYLNQKNIGTFEINNQDCIGELEFSGFSTCLKIWGNKEPLPKTIGNYGNQIFGSFKNLLKITLIDNGITERGFHTGTSDTGEHIRSEYLKIDPHYVIFGDNHIQFDKKCFDAIEFSFPNSNHLFLFESMTQLISVDKNKVENLIIEDTNITNTQFGFDASIDNFKFGEIPHVFIFTGALVLHEFEIPYGKLVIKNTPELVGPSNDGFSCKNYISCRIEFREPHCFWGAVKKIHPLLNLFELLLGQRQQINRFNLLANLGNEIPDIYDVYHSTDIDNKNKKLIHAMDRLFHIEKNSENFELVTTNWINKQEEWKFARTEYFGVFANRHYTSDKLIKLANLFNIIPDEAYTALDRTYLKIKIKHRMQIIRDSGLSELSDIETVINHCVDCRNYYVHGGNPKFDYINNFNEFCFLIDTLDFIYGVAEIIELGWEFKYWKPDSLNQHPFNQYLTHFQTRLTALKDLLNS